MSIPDAKAMARSKQRMTQRNKPRRHGGSSAAPPALPTGTDAPADAAPIDESAQFARRPKEGNAYRYVEERTLGDVDDDAEAMEVVRRHVASLPEEPWSEDDGDQSDVSGESPRAVALPVDPLLWEVEALEQWLDGALVTER